LAVLLFTVPETIAQELKNLRKQEKDFPIRTKGQGDAQFLSNHRKLAEQEEEDSGNHQKEYESRLTEKKNKRAYRAL